ncbi:MIP/aquaporin family protein [Streptomyces sp. AS58]|uniref:MIP/aquaporin family protein n=1 Tax=Streptomyces sp. AS58 TaxID=1519489 RepID=UPI00099BFFA1|nr:aquaporin [Streptomyces sp. AS58]
MSNSPQNHVNLARHTVYEFALTAALLFIVVSFIRWTALPSSPLVISDPDILFAAAGVAIATLIVVAMHSPLGRASGGHLHPGVTVFLWSSGLFPRRAVLPYVAAQLAGSLIGAGLAGLAWGEATGQVGYGAIQPRAGMHEATLFIIESSTIAAVFVLVALVMTKPRFQNAIPAVIGVSVGINIAVLGSLTGASINPARAFGPAVFSETYEYFWTYMIAPVLAPVLVGLINRAVIKRRASTAQATEA